MRHRVVQAASDRSAGGHASHTQVAHKPHISQIHKSHIRSHKIVYKVQMLRLNLHCRCSGVEFRLKIQTVGTSVHITVDRCRSLQIAGDGQRDRNTDGKRWQEIWSGLCNEFSPIPFEISFEKTNKKVPKFRLVFWFEQTMFE